MDDVRDRVELWDRIFGDRPICRRCGATTSTMIEVCSADLDVLCDGFVAMELAEYPDARNLTACPPEQLQWARRLIGQSVIDNATEI